MNPYVKLLLHQTIIAVVTASGLSYLIWSNTHSLLMVLYGAGVSVVFVGGLTLGDFQKLISHV